MRGKKRSWNLSVPAMFCLFDVIIADLFKNFVFHSQKTLYFRFYICYTINVRKRKLFYKYEVKGDRSMKTTILLRQVTIGDDVRALIEKKIGKLDKFFLENAEAFVTLSKKREKEILELTISANGVLFRSEVDGPTFCHAIDTAVNIIERQIRKNKTRLEKRLREGAFLDGATSPDENAEEETEFKIRKKSFSLKPMDVEEAIMQMNLLEHEFFVFEDQNTDQICVVYKRKDGTYGLIETSK